METTIQISKRLHDELTKKRLYNRETYEEIIWDIMEDTMELNERTKMEISQARKQIDSGQFKTLEQVKKDLRL